MSILSWLVLAIVAYFAHCAYQRVQFSRKKAEFIRDRRRAAGIPDDDNRPFAEARADALTRRNQQRRDEALSTPVKKRKNSLGRSKSQASIDHEAASRLAGIPGTLPGYLKDSFMSQPTQQRYEPSPTITSNHLRSPSPIKHRPLEGSSSQKTMRCQQSQTSADYTSTAKKSPVRNVREDSPSASAQRSLKRRHRASPIKVEAPEPEKNGRLNRKAQKVSVPGDFGAQGDITDEDMSDGTAAPAATLDSDGEVTDAMEEDEDLSASENRDRKQTTPSREGPLRVLQSAARATAKKREADELEESDAEGSVDTLDDDESYIQSQPHSSKRSRTVNKDIDPSSSLDFDIALPEEAMVDFDPIHDTTSSSSKDKSSQTQQKRQADTSDDRQPGQEWTDFEGLRWRIHPETHQLQRWSDVLEWRSKYHMPRDSLHPMAKESHQVVVHKWLTREEWEDTKAKKLLSFQEPERLAEKEKLDKEEAEKMRRKQELLAKIRQTSSPNKRIQSYLAQRQLQHKLSRGELSGDVSTNTYTTNDTNGDVTSMSIDALSVLGGDGATPSKPRSRRISLQSRMTPLRGGADTSTGSVRVGRDSVSTSGASSPSESPNRPRGSPLASPYRSIAYPKTKKGSSGTSSPLVTSTFPPPPPPSAS
ncbi:uncharacterized protein SPSC_02585 [Sporisorium scitamineum]|uniref:Uncharacterized protein n=1 Tax=Sporisorium scitamineum TaxID=49012 RepID=A0A127ZCZ8_9BASI|nr:uncharacterized protein SPSC_02585 [Sporisorium scitamineum]